VRDRRLTRPLLTSLVTMRVKLAGVMSAQVSWSAVRLCDPLSLNRTVASRTVSPLCNNVFSNFIAPTR
jgi:hypothetical protein